MSAIAAFAGTTDPRFVDSPPCRDPGDGEVLCRTLQLGVCGTDRDILESADPLVPPGEGHLILGHECLAQVEAVGAGLPPAANSRGILKTGDLVVPVVRRGMEPSRRADRVDLLPFGAYTERGIVREHGFSQPLWIDSPQHLFRVDPAIAEIAVLTEPLSVAEKGINEAIAVQRGRLGESTWPAGEPGCYTLSDEYPRVIVTGLGPIGFAAVIACRARGWPVSIFGRDPHTSFRARLAVELGASYQSDADGVFEPGNIEEHGYDLLLECTGAEEILLRASEAVRSCGAIVWLGSSRTPRPGAYNIGSLMRTGLLRNHVHIGSVNAAPRDFTDALAHLAALDRTHGKPLRAVITARVKPEESLWHYQHRQPQGIKTVLMF